MALSPVATPYAVALRDLAVDTQQLAVVRGQVEKVVRLVAASRDLAIAFENPTVTVEERKKIVVSLASMLLLSATTKNFLLVLAEKGRLNHLTDIGTAFGKLADDHMGIARAEVRSSAALNPSQVARLKAKLAELTNKTIEITNTVDPSLIGGIRVHVDGQVYDTSVAMQLRKLREAILQDI